MGGRDKSSSRGKRRGRDKDKAEYAELYGRARAGRSPSRRRSRTRSPHSRVSAARPKASPKGGSSRKDRSGSESSAGRDLPPGKALLKLIDRLPGEVVLTKDELEDVVTRLVALGFSSIGAFVGLYPDDVHSLYLDDSDIGFDQAPVVPRSGVRVLLHRLCAEAGRQTYHAPTPTKADKGKLSQEDVLWKIAKHVKPKKNVDKDSSSSDEDVDPFNIASFLNNCASRVGEARVLDPSWFADLNRLARLRRHFADRPAKGVPYIYSSSFDEWVPLWVGEAKSKSERKRLKSALQAEPAKSLANLLSVVANYWLSHMSAGAVTLPAVLAHILQVVRVAQERSVAFAYTYVSRLQARLVSDIKSGLSFDLNERISGRDASVFNQVELEVLREAGRPDPKGVASPWGSGRYRKDQPPPRGGQPPPRAPRPPAPPPTPPTGAKTEPAKQRLVCFQHDPAGSHRCTVRGCRYEHVDTRTPEGLKRFQQAKQAAGK